MRREPRVMKALNPIHWLRLLVSSMVAVLVNIIDR